MKTIKTLTLAAFATFALTGCDDALDFYPEITTNEANTMDKIGYYDAEVNNWYSWLRNLWTPATSRDLPLATVTAISV